MKYVRVALAAGMAVLAGCTELPTGGRPEFRSPAASGPHFDGGLVFGSGNRAAGDTPFVAGEQQDTTVAAGDDLVVTSGGYTFGGGN